MNRLFLLFCLYLPFQIALNPVEGIDLASVRIIIPILALIWLISALKNRQIFVPAKIETGLILFFLFLAGLSLFWAENTSWGIRKILFLLSIFPIYFIVANLLKSDFNRIIKIIKFITWGAGLAAAAGIIQFVLQFIIGLDATTVFWRNYITPLFLGRIFSQVVAEYSSWAVSIGGRDYLRAFGTFPDPHMFSFYLGLTLPLAGTLFWTSDVQNGRKKYLFLFLIILLADFLTFSRGGYIGLAAGLIFIISYFILTKKISTEKIFAFLVLIIFLFMLLALSPIGKRFIASFSAEEGSNKGRFENWKQAVEIIKNYPQGVGIGNYAYEIEPSADYHKPIYAHNLYLDIAAETGIINALIFIAILLFSIRSFIIKSKDNIFYLGGAISLIIFSVHSIFDAALYSVQVLPMLLIVIALNTGR